MSTTAKFFWATLALTMAVYLTMVLWSLPHLSEMAGGRPAFELRPAGYSAQEARVFIAALGAPGVEFYLNTQQRLDTAYPGLLALMLILAFRLLARGWWVWVLAAVAVLAGGFDYLENAAVAEMLQVGPAALTDAMVANASRWTVLKSAATTMAYVALLILLFRAGWRWMRRRRPSAGSPAVT